MGGLFTGIKDVNVVERGYGAPYSRVWPAVKKAAERFEKIGKRDIVDVNERSGRIQVGRISEDGLVGSGVGAWGDEFVIEATSTSDTWTKVSVTRKVVEKEINPKNLATSWKTQWSNGKIESWLQTQVEDVLNGR